MTVTIVEFIEARLDEEAKAADAMPDPAKHRRIVDVLALICTAVITQIEMHKQGPTDNPLAAGLLPTAHVWSDHPDFDPPSWFPRMIGQMK